MTDVIQDKEASQLLDTIWRDHTQLKEVNALVSEHREQLKGVAELREKQEKINTAISETQKAYEERVAELKSEISELKNEIVQSKRPSGNGEFIDPELQIRHSAYEKFLRYGEHETGQKRMTQQESRALSGAKDKEGGFLIPSVWDSSVLMKAFEMSAIRPAANVAPTGNDVVFLSMSKPSVGWGVIDQKVIDQSITAGQTKLQIFDIVALVRIAINVLEDAEADVWGELRNAFAMAIAEAEDSAFSIGTGGTMPLGIFTNADVQANFVKTGVAAALSDSSAAATDGFQMLVNVMAKLKSAYKSNASWAFNSTTEGKMRLFHSSVSKEYFTEIWSPPSTVGQASTLLGKPIIRTEFAPDVAANAFPIVFGDFSNYKIRDRAGISIQRLAERYSEYREVGFQVTKRVGGLPVLASEAWVSVKVAA